MNKLERVRSIIQPGDVINNEGADCIWYKPFNCLLTKTIQFYQKRIFGYDADNRSTHSSIYFAEDKVFSARTPRTLWESLQERVDTKFVIYRYTPIAYTDKHLDIMYNTALEMLHLPYDVGDLLDIMISTILGYDNVRRIRWFEFSKRYTVCSTAVRTIQEKLRKSLEAEGDFSIQRLFDKLNPAKWKEQKLEKFIRTDVEMTTPAHYANSEYFSGEFKLICHWREF